MIQLTNLPVKMVVAKEISRGIYDKKRCIYTLIYCRLGFYSNDLFPLELRHCGYEQLARDVQVITRELFKRLNLKAG
ncbi:hypothetical protein FBD94_21155 [Pedobacter hiemivivus]|uniref:Uncharacterized protein n=1 Tax=Pedobacter hiemivivus TaxID=2530454 RepID=A0A4U1G8A5_9SPHI|nr:hypothetical protein [Pedobacter hiemivivus]TKC57142.1 hypothetical protein FBD94_21155 [Pedobacter hiemivivus]